MENSCVENCFWWCSMVISAVYDPFLTKLYDKITGEYNFKRKKPDYLLSLQCKCLGFKVPRHHSHFYYFKGFVASKIKCPMFSEDLKSSGVKRMVVLSVYRGFALGPISHGGLCPEHLTPHSIWHLLMTDIFCLGIKSTLFSFKLTSALWNISKWCCAIPYWCLLPACWVSPWSW